MGKEMVVFHLFFFARKCFQNLAHSARPKGESVFSRAQSLSYRRLVCELVGGDRGRERAGGLVGEGKGSRSVCGSHSKTNQRH